MLISIERKLEGLNIGCACSNDRLVFWRAHSDPDDLRRTNIAVCGMRMFFTPFSIKQQLKYQSSYPYPGLFGAYGNFLRSVIGAIITEFQRPDRTLNKISWSLVVQPVFWTIESAPSNSMV